MIKPVLTPAEFRDKGFLQEVNRQFFHPLGLALAIESDDELDTEGYFRVSIWDYRDDPEGMFFAQSELAPPEALAKCQYVAELRKSKATERLRVAGCVVQDVPFQGFLTEEAELDGE